MPTILITGANRGLGLEFVRQYAADGWDVIACCRNPAKATDLQKLAAKQENILIETLDVTDLKSIDALAKNLKDRVIDLLINNAGILSGDGQSYAPDRERAPDGRMNGEGQSFGSIDAAGWQKVLAANTIAPVMMLQAFVSHLMRSENPKLVNITSKMGSIGEMGTGYIAYRTSKAALNAAMCNIGPDLQAKKIAWVNFHPGWVQTDMGGKSADITPDVSITGMRKVIAGLTLKNTGQFLDYQGKTVPW